MAGAALAIQAEPDIASIRDGVDIVFLREEADCFYVRKPGRGDHQKIRLNKEWVEVTYEDRGVRVFSAPHWYLRSKWLL